MEKIFLLMFGVILNNLCFAQVTFTINSFSDKYFGKLYVTDTTEDFSKGWIAIYDNQTQKMLFKVNSDESLRIDMIKENPIITKTKRLHSDQYFVIHKDYNFDGIKDFAIMDGSNGCYGSPSYQIYLALENGFKHSPAFTELTQDYCDLEVNYKSKRLSTFTKSGCCWHQYSEFGVKDNKPYPVKIIEEEYEGTLTVNYTESNLVNGKMVTTKYSKLYEEEISKEDIVLSFQFTNKKKMQIFKKDRTLFYVFTDNSGKIELIYHDGFSYQIQEKSLKFKVYDTEYTIFDDRIVAKVSDKTYDMKAEAATRLGTITKLAIVRVDNVKIK